MDNIDYRSNQFIYGIVGETYTAFNTERPFPDPFSKKVVEYSCNTDFLNAGVPGFYCYYPMMENNRLLIAFSQTLRKLNTGSVGYNAQVTGWEWESQKATSRSGSLNYLLLENFNSILASPFYTEAELDSLAGQRNPVPFCPQHTEGAEAADVRIDSKTLKAIVYGVMRSWAIYGSAVTIAVPEGVNYNEYALSAVRQIYSCFPLGMRVQVGFCTFLPPERARQLHNVLVGFVPRHMADEKAVSLDGSTISAVNRLSKGTGLHGLDLFVDYVCSLGEDERARFLDRVNEESEGRGDPKKISGISAAKYSYYGDALRILNLSGTAEQLLPEWIRFYQQLDNYPKSVSDKIREKIHKSLSCDALAEALRREYSGVQSPEELISRTLRFNALCGDSEDWSMTAWDELRSAAEPLLAGGTARFSYLLKKNLKELDNIASDVRILSIFSIYEAVLANMNEADGYFGALKVLEEEAGRLKPEEVQSLHNELAGRKAAFFAAYVDELKACLGVQELTAETISTLPPVFARAVLKDLTAYDSHTVDVSHMSFEAFRAAVYEHRRLASVLGCGIKVCFTYSDEAAGSPLTVDMPAALSVAGFTVPDSAGTSQALALVRKLVNNGRYPGRYMPEVFSYLRTLGYFSDNETGEKVLNSILRAGKFPGAADDDIILTLEFLRKNVFAADEDSFLGIIHSLDEKGFTEDAANAVKKYEQLLGGSKLAEQVEKLKLSLSDAEEKERSARGETEKAVSELKSTKSELRDAKNDLNAAKSKLEDTSARLEKKTKELEKIRSAAKDREVEGRRDDYEDRFELPEEKPADKAGSNILTIILGVLCAVLLAGSAFICFRLNKEKVDLEAKITTISEEKENAEKELEALIAKQEKSTARSEAESKVRTAAVIFSLMLKTESNREFLTAQAYDLILIEDPDAATTAQAEDPTLENYLKIIENSGNEKYMSGLNLLFWKALASVQSDATIDRDKWEAFEPEKASSEELQKAISREVESAPAYDVISQELLGKLTNYAFNWLTAQMPQ